MEMATKLVFQNGQEIVVLENHNAVEESLSQAYGKGFTSLRRDLGTAGEIPVTVNPTTVAFIEGLPELTQIGNVFG
jgi:hypothetical protein